MFRFERAAEALDPRHRPARAVPLAPVPRAPAKFLEDLVYDNPESLPQQVRVTGKDAANVTGN